MLLIGCDLSSGQLIVFLEQLYVHGNSYWFSLYLHLSADAAVTRICTVGTLLIYLAHIALRGAAPVAEWVERFDC